MRSIALRTLLLVSTLAFAQSAQPYDGGAPSEPTTEAVSVPSWVPFRIPQRLYEKWRKYGPWDYKQQSFTYRDFTLFNFGATGSAAGFDQNTMEALAKASKPTPEDVGRFDSAELESKFNHDQKLFETLRSMAEQDAGVIRIAPDFTWLESNTSWPRKDIGFSESHWNDYRSLFGKLSVPDGIVRSQDFPGAIFFVANSRGLCTGGSSDGYVYSSKPLSPVAKNPADTLNAEARKNPDKHYAYIFKVLTPNWYTFYEVDW